jgi:hypothetical protein
VSTRRALVVCALLLLCAAGVRAYRVGRWSLDVDEAFSPQETAQVNAGTLRDYVLLRNAHLVEAKPRSTDWQDRLAVIQVFITHTFPLYYLLLRPVLAAWGTHELSLRLLSVLFGVLAVPLAYWLGRRHFSERTGWLFAAFTLFHPLIQFHSQNARYYALAYFAALLVMHGSLAARRLLVDGADSPARGGAERRRAWTHTRLAIFGLLLWVPMLIHASSIFALVFAAVILLETLLELGLLTFLRRARAMLLPLLAGGVVVAANQLFFLRGRLHEGFEAGDQVTFGGSYLVHNLVSLIFNFGLHFWLLVPVALWLLWRDRGRDRQLRGLVVALLLGLVVYAAFSLRTTEIRFDYFYPALPCFLLVAAVALDRAAELLLAGPRKAPVVACLGAFVVLIGLPSLVSTAAIDGDRTDWRGGLEWLHRDATRRGQASPLVYSAAPGLVAHYTGAASTRRLRDLDPDKVRPGDYVLVPWKRAGLDLRGTPERVERLILEGSTLVQVLGKDRLDLHINRLAVFRIR